MDDSQKFIQIIRSAACPIDKKIAAVNRLISMDNQIASLGICHACLVKNETLMKRSCKAIREFSYSRFSDLINFILEEETADTRYARKKFLDLLYKLRRRDMLKYIVENAILLASDEQKRRIIAPWLRQSQALQRLITALFTMPTKTARILVKILKGIDSGVTLDIVKFMKSSPSQVIIKGLDILQDISTDNDIAPFLMNLFNSGDQKVKSKVTLMLGKMSDKLIFVKTALRNGDSRVRANALEAIWEEDTPEVKDVFASHLDDKNNRARANAAMGLCKRNDERGFKALMEMAHDKDKMMRASAAWVLGEVKEVRAINRLQTLKENDPEEIVHKNATIALEKMDAPLLRLLKYFAALGTRVPSLEESEPTAVKEFLAIAKFLEDMNPEKQTEMVAAIKNISPETSARMWETLESIAPEEDVPLALLMASLYSNEAKLRAASTKLLGEDCDDEHFFNHAMRSPDAIVRARAIEALWRRLGLKPQEMEFAKPILQKSLEDDDGKVVASAAIGLHQLNIPSGAKTIWNMLDDEDSVRRAIGAWAAGEATFIDAKERLAELQQDGDQLVKRNSTEALAKINALLEKQEAEPNAMSIKINYLDTSEMPLVWCFVSVLDNKGRTIDKLSRENFALAENDFPVDDHNVLPPKDGSEGEAYTSGLADIFSLDGKQGGVPEESAGGSAPQPNGLPAKVKAGEGESGRAGEASLPDSPPATPLSPTTLFHSSVALVMDYSESMSPEDTTALEEAATVFVSQMPNGNRGAIIKFSGEVSVVQPFTDERKLLTDAIRNDYEVNSDKGTVLYDSIYETVKIMSDEQGNKAIIVLTDGDDSDSDKSLEELIGFANRQRAAIHTIGLGEELNADVLKQISKATGGSSYLGADQSNLINTYKSISDELKKQYVLSYTRKSSEIRGIVTLQVKVEYGDLKAKDAVPLKSGK